MPNVLRGLAVCVVASVILEGRGGSITAIETPAFVMRIANRAHVTPGELVKARTLVKDIFQAAGVEAAWVERQLPASESEEERSGNLRRVDVWLVRIENAQFAATRAGCALGLADPARDTAYVFYNRVFDTTQSRPVDAGVVLGRIIAHEVGHVLIPGRQSPHGIMRGHLDFNMTNPDRFSDDEARRIRALLTTQSGKDGGRPRTGVGRIVPRALGIDFQACSLKPLEHLSVL